MMVSVMYDGVLLSFQICLLLDCKVAEACSVEMPVCGTASRLCIVAPLSSLVPRI